MWSIRRHWTVEAACGCSIGRQRSNNEDNFLFLGHYLPQENNGLDRVLTGRRQLKEHVFFAVFDGMGGEAYGEEAAWIAAKTLRTGVEQPEGQPVDLEAVCQEANREICAQARWRSVGLEGTTVAILAIYRREAQVVNLGDSKVFLLRNGKLSQLSVDHTDQALLRAQEITSRKPRLTQHLGIEPEDMVLQPTVSQITIRPKDRFLLCTDGLTDMVETEEIRNILWAQEPAGAVVEQLIGRALENGGRDNITVICCQVYC